MKELMIDIETLGVKRGCLILSIGAKFFDKNGLTDASFYSVLNRSMSELHSWEVDEKTLEWWYDQDPDVRNEAFSGKTHPGTAIENLASFILKHKGDEEIKVWANPPQFDLEILKAYFHFYEVKLPWSHRDERCLRTYVYENGGKELKYKYLNASNERHNALVDCDLQIRYLTALRSVMQGVDPSIFHLNPSKNA
ncbi:3'-5' exonuclease [Flammeovirga aprica]|uniref:3'-5' exoribonuclease n=1 Tax=Flammeovirga aprica JL-4 TaxID=694437 RepID=A0A7X9P2F7_9BACT|nr:3'-5' exonuclease [Flammeovirga aprica]NME67182.1 3'-5' exoribonuclease [Flammeovirga aprica JL-4]